MLLSSRHTVMAHAPFLTADDLALFRTRGAAVAHCPLSNFYYANSVFPIRRARAAGVMVGMGTDVGGAPSSCMFQACRDSVAASKALQDGVSPLGGAVSRPPDMPGAAINHGTCAPPILAGWRLRRVTIASWHQSKRSMSRLWVVPRPWGSTSKSGVLL